MTHVEGYVPVVIDKDGNNVHQQSSLSTRDLEHIEQVQAPVFDRDARDQAVLDDSIYFCNRSGRLMKILGTTHRVDRRGQDSRDPDNYDLTIDQDVQNNSIFKIPVENVIYVEITFVKPDNTFREGMRVIAVTDPNGKRGTLRYRDGALHLDVRKDESLSPHAFKLENRTAAAVHAKIYTENPCLVPATKFQVPKFSCDLEPREHYEFTWVPTYRFWLVDWFKPTQASAQDEGAFTSYSATDREAGSRDFRSGTIAWFACAKHITPGQYIFIVSNSNSGGARYVLAPYSHDSLNIIPLREFLGETA